METLKYKSTDGQYVNSIEFNSHTETAVYRSYDENGLPICTSRHLNIPQWTNILSHHVMDRTMVEYSCTETTKPFQGM